MHSTKWLAALPQISSRRAVHLDGSAAGGRSLVSSSSSTAGYPHTCRSGLYAHATGRAGRGGAFGTLWHVCTLPIDATRVELAIWSAGRLALLPADRAAKSRQACTSICHPIYIAPRFYCSVRLQVFFWFFLCFFLRKGVGAAGDGKDKERRRGDSVEKQLFRCSQTLS